MFVFLYFTTYNFTVLSAQDCDHCDSYQLLGAPQTNKNGLNNVQLFIFGRERVALFVHAFLSFYQMLIHHFFVKYSLLPTNTIICCTYLSTSAHAYSTLS